MLTTVKLNKTLPKAVLVEETARDLRPTFQGWGPRI